LFDWAAVQDTELAFSKGDVIIVTSQADPSWWFGKKESDGAEG
jgi:SH3 domain